MIVVEENLNKSPPRLFRRLCARCGKRFRPHGRACRLCLKCKKEKSKRASKIRKGIKNKYYVERLLE